MAHFVRSRRAAIAGACAALLFVGATSWRLKRPGLFYDELHQAVGAFAWVGRPTTMFSVMPVNGVPLLNMPYSGAVKTAIYGLYLRFADRGFSVLSWRLLGIAFAAAGFLVFAFVAGGRLSPAELALLFALLLSDSSLLLLVRHDWGPVALAFLLRMVFVALWLRRPPDASGRAIGFLLGLVVGLAMFEKLSSAVLLGPLAIILGSGGRRGRPGRLALGGAGVLVGALPVLAANLVSWFRDGVFLALQGTSNRGHGLLAYAGNLLALGSGGNTRAFVFGEASPAWIAVTEGLSLATLLALVARSSMRRSRTEAGLARAGTALASYAAVALLLAGLPAQTGEHHWILATPFQYLAIALAAGPILSSPRGSRATRALFVVALVALGAARVGALAAAGRAIRNDRYGPAWDPALNRFAERAAKLPGEAIFVAADWGVATQVFCFANGRQDFVYEPFWDYRGRESLAPLLEWPGREYVLAAAPRPRSDVHPGVPERIFSDLARYPGWSEVAVDPALRDLGAVEVHAFRRDAARAGEGAGAPPRH